MAADTLADDDCGGPDGGLMCQCGVFAGQYDYDGERLDGFFAGLDRRGDLVGGGLSGPFNPAATLGATKFVGRVDGDICRLGGDWGD